MSYSKRDLLPADPYFDKWMMLGRVWRRSLALFVLFFWGGPILTTVILEPRWPNPPALVVVALLAPWVIAAIVVSQAPVRWPCPRCGKPFYKTFWAYNPFARRCLHCKLPKWAPGPDAADPTRAAA